MGLFNTYGNVQLKVGDLCMADYTIGDTVDIPDGVYLGHEGFIVIHDGVFLSEHPVMTDKWGHTHSAADVMTLVSGYELAG